MSALPESVTTQLADRYRIERELGAGGMATVYLAHDLRHDRRVALKVLKPELSAVVGADRFLAEIRTTANLQHPHILSLFDSGSVNGMVYYVMPFVDGESLRDRLERERQLPVNDAVLIAQEVADALQYAHDHGVIHRDIKPENILLQGGHALVADFGIALAASNTAGGRITETGMSLGTPTYMSPEQAMGERTLDARTDVYALGCVTYEMLIGEPPFTGSTAQQIVARVMTEEPRSLTGQRKTIPHNVDAAITAALSKLPADRPATAAAFAQMLRDQHMRVPSHAQSGPKQAMRTSLALAVALLLTAAVAVKGWTRSTPEAPVTRSFLKLPGEEAPAAREPSFTLTPDGTALIYTGTAPNGATQLWIKKRASLHATPIAGTLGASGPFLTSDGKWIGFVAGGKVKRVPISGGDAASVADVLCFGVTCDELYLGSGAWLDDGRLIYRTRDVFVLVPANGGTPDTIVSAGMVGGWSAILPSALPDSRGFVFTTCTLACNRSAIWSFDMSKRKATRLLDNASFARYLPDGRLLYADPAGALYSVAFDPRTLSITGSPVKVLEHVTGSFSVSNNGTLAYLDGDASPRSYLTVVNQSGVEQPLDTAWRANFSTLALAPDGKRVAVSIVTGDGEEHVWLTSPGSLQAPMRATFGAGQFTTPRFASDGNSLFITHFDADSSSFIKHVIDGSKPDVILQHGKNWVIESDVSRDGRWLITRGYRPGGVRAVYAKDVSGAPGADTAERLIVENGVSAFSPALSPDARWILYASEESRGVQVWAVPFQNPKGAKWQVSNDGGTEPAWSADGRAIFYVNAEQQLVRVAVGPSATSLDLGERHVLFPLAGYKRHPTHRAYEVLPDGQHFLMIRQGQRSAGDLVMVENWFSEWRQK